MRDERAAAQERVTLLHAEEQQEKRIALGLPPGEEHDRHWMRGERLSDEAWSIEEAYDLDPVPSGLWR
ncbi:hypothetical protein [Sphingomonas sp. BK235]|jgi:hypothetical protein|uniref:hypothetical protein n=1 Tax=Sphingomonas sp. BK235 TaxID=2512131 RepID=UPI0010526F8C|nr:hypothetical protein [Sphingomonas sp. BK235]TCP37391.1 hypothetical protein EV292_101909 [Sphingomonas sp. BK235]